MARDLKISRRSAQKIFTQDLGLFPYKTRKLHGLTEAQMNKRMERCKNLFDRYVDEDIEFIVYCDEKLFSV